MPDDPIHDRTWGEYRRLILSELERMSADIKGISEKIEKFRQDDIATLKTDIALLKFQAGMWGAVAGAVVTGIVALVFRLMKV